MALGVYGKHPAKGDFLEHGLPEGLRAALESWLDTTLTEARAVLGPEWEQSWLMAPALRFWLGEAVWGRPIAGVMIPSQDRVGRRFPLVLLAFDSALPPPPLAAGQDWHDHAERHLAALLCQHDFAGSAAVVQGIDDPAPPPLVDSADFWAVREGDGIAALWADVAATDHRRAATGRSYWWVAGAAAPAEDAASADADPEPITPPAEDPGTVPPSVAPVPHPPAEEEPVAAAAADCGACDPAAPGAADAKGEPARGAAAEGAEISPWDTTPPEFAGRAEQDDSPFAAPASGLDLFAPPETPTETPTEPAAEAEAALPFLRDTMQEQTPATVPHRAGFSQVWAGPGLPTGQVIAWLLRGFQQNG